MIDDLAKVGDNLAVSCDVCVIGSGAAGLAIGVELSNSTLRVIILEAGGETTEDETQRLYDCEVSGIPYAGAEHGRFRVFGGSTTRWGGQALPLTQLDFEKRDWVQSSGWPISHSDLEFYYRRAARFLHVDEDNYDTDVFSRFGLTAPSFDPNELTFHASKWSPTPNLAAVYRARICQARNTLLLLHANVTKIALDEYRRSVTHVVASTLLGRRVQVSAREVVVCCGGLETARLLLANNQEMSCGIGNEHDMVGRYLQDHPGALVGTVQPRNPEAFQRLFNLRHASGVKYSLRCSATPQLQRREQMLNASAGIMFLPGDSSLSALKTVYHSIRARRADRELAAALARVALHPFGAIQPVFEYLVRHRTYTPNARFLLGLTTEQEPNPDSRVRLSSELDALGLPKMLIDWRPTDATWHTASRFVAALQRQFERAGLGTIELDEWFCTPGAWKTKLVDHYHHIGTARMHESPAHGVVDADCRVHAIDNLYVGSSAVFPTGGHSNPTLTIIALCIRLADRLRDLSRRGTGSPIKTADCQSR